VLALLGGLGVLGIQSQAPRLILGKSCWVLRKVLAGAARCLPNSSQPLERTKPLHAGVGGQRGGRVASEERGQYLDDLLILTLALGRSGVCPPTHHLRPGLHR
jgi:hypothetical protein